MLDIFQVEEEEYFWKLSDQIKVLSLQVIRAEKVPADDYVRLKVHKSKWTEPRWTGLFEVVAKTSHAFQIRQ